MYRIVPVHPDDHPLPGMSWDNHLYVDAALPFGLCSAAKLFQYVDAALPFGLCSAAKLFLYMYVDAPLLFGLCSTTKLFLYVDAALPFGLCSAAKLFNANANGTQVDHKAPGH